MGNDFIDFKGGIIDYSIFRITFGKLDGFIINFSINKKFNLYYCKVITSKEIIIKLD